MPSVAMSETETPHILPHNFETEEAVLAAMMTKAECIDSAISMNLRDTDFYRTGHRIIYEVIRYLHERGTVDEVTVINELRARKKLTAAGGASLILDMQAACRSVANHRAYIDEVIDQSTLRSMVSAGHEVARLGYEHPDKVKKLVDRSVTIIELMAQNANRDSGAVGDANTLSDWVIDHLSGSDLTREKYHYPLPKLQHATGGFGRGQLVSIGARPGGGKSAFKNQMILALDPSVRVGIVSLEMDRQDEQIRFISALTGIPGRRIWERDLTAQEQSAIAVAAAELKERNYEIHQGSKTFEAVRALQKKNKYDVLFLDHAHKLQGASDYKTFVNASRGLKDLSIDTDCAVVSLFQLNKAEDRTLIPTPDDVKGGGSIEEDSDHLFFIHRKYNSAGYPTTAAELICAKQRGGEFGWQIPCVFDGNQMLFREA